MIDLVAENTGERVAELPENAYGDFVNNIEPQLLVGLEQVRGYIKAEDAAGNDVLPSYNTLTSARNAYLQAQNIGSQVKEAIKDKNGGKTFEKSAELLQKIQRMRSEIGFTEKVPTTNEGLRINNMLTNINRNLKIIEGNLSTFLKTQPF